jgi:hypothetical protein
MMDAWTSTKVMIASVGCLFVLGCSATAIAQCQNPIVRIFGVADNFSTSTPDPIPYKPALPQFVSFLKSQGIATANMTTFDAQTKNLHMVATLRHGLGSCFGGATALQLCFKARAIGTGANNDSVTIYNTDFTNNTFPVIYSQSIVPTLAPTWTTGTTSLLCIDLTPKMSQIGAILQFRLQDDTAVDYIAIVLFP